MLDTVKKIIDENNIVYIIQTNEFAVVENCFLEYYADGDETEESLVEQIKYFPASQFEYLMRFYTCDEVRWNIIEWIDKFFETGNVVMTRKHYELEIFDRADFFKEQK